MAFRQARPRPRWGARRPAGATGGVPGVGQPPVREVATARRPVEVVDVLRRRGHLHEGYAGVPGGEPAHLPLLPLGGLGEGGVQAQQPLGRRAGGAAVRAVRVGELVGRRQGARRPSGTAPRPAGCG